MSRVKEGVSRREIVKFPKYPLRSKLYRDEFSVNPVRAVLIPRSKITF